MTEHTPTPWRVDEPGLWIVADNVPKGPMHIADVRGWGYLTGTGHGALGLKAGDALAIQRANAERRDRRSTEAGRRNGDDIMTKHTPTPWAVRETTINGIKYGGCWIEQADDNNLVQISGSGGAQSFTNRVVDIQIHDDNDANAAFIVQCANAHEALVRALADALFIMELNVKRYRPTWDRRAAPQSAIGQARAALSLAGVPQLDPPGCVSA